MSDIQQGLLIAAIGMGLVFAVIIFLWGLMALMMRVTSRENPSAAAAGDSVEEDALMVPEMQTAEGHRRAAAAAVAVGLAMAASQSSTVDTHGGLSPWQSFHRSRQLGKQQSRG